MPANPNASRLQVFFNLPPSLDRDETAYPVTMGYLESPTPNYIHTAVHEALRIHAEEGPGHILIFMPGENDVESVYSQLRTISASLKVLRLFRALPVAEQQILCQQDDRRRKCIVSTNIAEISVTIDGIGYVIDCGMVKQMRYNPRARVHSLKQVAISKVSALQRAAIAGGTQPGKCLRLYTKEAFAKFRESDVSQALISDAKPAVLTLMARGVRDIWLSDWSERPHPEILHRAIEELNQLGFVCNGRLTRIGCMAESSSVGPLWYNVLLKGVKYKCFYEIAAITAIASARTSIFVWPTKFRPAAHLVLSTFFHPCSDHMTGLNAYFKYKYMLEEGVVDPRHWCENHFLSLAALGEVNSLYRNILEMFDLANMDSVEFLDPSYDKNIRWALAEGLCYQVAYDGAKNPKGRTTDLYRTINDNQPALLSATSVLANNQDVHWVVFSEYVHTGKQYLQGVTAINPEWLIDLPYFQNDTLAKKTTGEYKQPGVHAALEEVRARVRANS